MRVCSVVVKVILSSKIIRRELANPQVAKSLFLNLSTTDPDDHDISRRNFVDSLAYRSHARVLSSNLCFGLFDKAYIGDVVVDIDGNIFILVDVITRMPSHLH